MSAFELMRSFGISGAAISVAVELTLIFGCSRPLRPEPEVHAPAKPANAPGVARPAAAGLGAAAHASAEEQGVAVVELFTSEGCSSCPPADRVLSALASRAAAEDLAVYTLSFHVDYWNYLGWRDRFSSPAYSERQRGYSAINPAGGTYTPQAVINGSSECVGSDASRIDSYVAAALRRKPSTRVELEAHRTENRIQVGYRVSGDIAGRVLNLALLEPQAHSSVNSGENAGERLVHVNVVRAFTSRALASASDGTWSVEPSEDFGAHRVGVVAYVEEAAQRAVSGAAALELD